MPKITNNNGDLSKAFFGTAEVEKIFLGSTELYSKAAPVSYVIKAGLYYGKDSPVLTNINVPLSFTSPSFSGIDFTSLNIGLSRIIYYYAGDYEVGWNGSWLARTIMVSSDTTVTQAQYEAFFACFGGYGGTVQLYSGGTDDLYVKINGVCSRSSYDANPYVDELYVNVPNGVTVNLYNPMYDTFDNIVAVNCTYQFNTSTHNMVVTPTADNWSFTAQGYD